VNVDGGTVRVQVTESTQDKPAAAPSSAAASSSSGSTKRKQPQMTVAEMQVLYIKCRQVKLQWEPDEEGCYLVPEVDSVDVIKMDSVVPHGTGKNCGSSLGAKYTQCHLRWCMLDDMGEEIYVPDMDPIVIRAPDILRQSKLNQLLSHQTTSHDFIPSVPQMAHTLYEDCKIVKFDKLGHQKPFAWSIVDTVASASKTTPVVLRDCEFLTKIGGALHGPYPDTFKEYVIKMDEKLMELANKALLVNEAYAWMREHHPEMFLPKPVEQLRLWSHANDEDKIIEVCGENASHDIVYEECCPHMKGKRLGDRGVPVEVSKQQYDEVIKALPARRRLVQKMGCVLFEKETFDLPVTPVDKFIKKSEKPPPPSAKAKAAASQKPKAGRPQGGGQAKKVAESARSTRSAVATKKPAPPPFVPPPPPPPPPPLSNASMSSKNSTRNTSQNAAAGTVPGGSPLPPFSHVSHDDPSQNLTSPGSNMSGSLTSAQSAAMTERFDRQDAKLEKLTEKLENRRTAEYADMMQVKSENMKLREQLALANCNLAAKTATITALERQAETTKTMQQQWTTMCNSMLGTIEVLQAGSKT
jgi:hypothetical protein